MDLTSDELLKKIERMPEEIKDFLFDENNSERIVSIAQKHGLSVEKIDYLMREITYVLAGITNTRMLQRKLESLLDLGPNEAAALIKELNEVVLYKIKDKLKEIYEKPAALGRFGEIKPTLQQEYSGTGAVQIKEEEKNVLLETGVEIEGMQPENAQKKLAPEMAPQRDITEEKLKESVVTKKEEVEKSYTRVDPYKELI